MAGCQGVELSTLAVVKRTTADQQRASAGLDDRREGSIDFAFCSGFHDQDLPPERAGRHLHVPQQRLDVSIVRIPQQGDDGRLGKQLMQQFQPLCVHKVRGIAHAGDVAARPVEAGDEAALVARRRRQGDRIACFLLQRVLSALTRGRAASS
jgi:hypothetical protein